MRDTYLRAASPRRGLYDRVLDDTGCGGDLELMAWMLARGSAPIVLYWAFVAVLRMFT